MESKLAPIISMDIVKSSNKSVLTVGETVTFKLVVTNTGDVTIGIGNTNPVYIYDILPSELALVENSTRIDGILDSNLNILSGINLGSLDPSESKTITFDAKVVSYNKNIITNNATGTFGYTIPGSGILEGNAISNTLELTISIVSLDITKKGDMGFVVLGDTITYTVNIINNGTIEANNVIFMDTLPNNVEIINGSFNINGVTVNNVNLEQGINIGNIAVGDTTVIEYKVNVILPNCSLQIKNLAQAEFSYVLSDGTTGNAIIEATPNSTSNIDIGISNFKQLSVEEYLNIPSQKPDIEQINTVSAKVSILKCHVIETGVFISEEGQNLTGYKLIIYGAIELTIEYTACDEEQSVHSAHYNIPFSTFIVLPNNYSVGSKVEVEGVVEDSYYKVINCRTFFSNNSVLINAKILRC